MNSKIQLIFKNLEKELSPNCFLFWQFYLKPAEFNESIVINNQFLEFLEACLDDITFIKRLNDLAIKKIKSALLTKKEYIQYDYITGRGLNLDLLSLLIQRIEIEEESYYEAHLRPQEERESVLKRIKKDDYTKEESCFLYYHNSLDKKTFFSLVCNNEFLNIIETILINQELSDVIINNIINILQTGIDFKIFRLKEYHDFLYHYERLGKKKVNKFDYKEALELIEKLKNKKIESPQLRLVLID